MGENMQRFGNVLADRMKKSSRAAVGISAELGTINSNLSLSVDSLKTPIPKGDYMVNLLLTSNSYRTGSTESHTHSLPSTFRNLKAGDRVLIVWCGTEPVVAAIVVRS